MDSILVMISKILSTERILPECYCFDSSLINILHERYTNFEIYWFHWPRDGLVAVQDYEPVIIVYHNTTEVCRIIVRRGWKFVTSSGIGITNNRFRVLFDLSFHHPFVESSVLTTSFIEITPLLQRPVVLVRREEIPDMFRTGRSHPTNRGNRIHVDPFNYAESIYSDFCDNI